MKLYSRGQVARRISYGVMVAFVLTAVLFYNLGKKQGSRELVAEDSEIIEAVDYPEITVTVASNQSGNFTQDENDIISVYRNCN